MDCQSDEVGHRQCSAGGCTVKHDPKEAHVKVARKIFEYMSATAHLGLTFRRDSKLEKAQLEYDLEKYVNAVYAHKAEARRSVSGMAVRCGGTIVSWFSWTQECVTLSTTEAEYVTMADGVKDALYVRGVLVFLMPRLGSPSIGVFENNASMYKVPLRGCG